MTNRLEIEVGAEIKELQKKLAQAEKELNSFDKTADKNLGKFSKSTKTATKDIKGFQKGTANGSSAMLAFSRTVQDAPFGMMGISNNITNLTEQFGYLQKKTGSAGGALKLMLKDLAGFGGITFAISLATSAWLVFGDSIMDAVNGNNAFAKSQKEVQKALDDFYGNSVSKINSYISILDDVNTSEEQRKNITNELIKIVPNLKKADFDYGNNLDLVRKKIGDYVLAQASRVEADSLVEQNANKLSKLALLNAKITAAKISKTQQGSLTFLNVDKNEAEKLRKYLKSIDLITTRWVSGQLVELSDVDLVKKAKDSFVKLENELKPVTDRIKELYGETFSGGLGGETIKPIKPINLPKIKAKDEVTGLFEDYYTDYQTGQQGFQDLVLGLPIDFTSLFKDFNPKKEEFKERLNVFNSEVSELLNFTQQDGILNFGQAIGNAIGNGTSVVKAAGASLLGTLGSLMVKYGSLIVKFGLAKEALSKSLKNPFGGGIGAIVAGGALVAIGSAIKGFSSNMASGGETGNSNAGAGSSFSGGSTFTSGVNDTSQQGMTLVLRGEDMYGALNTYIGRQRNLGTNLTFG